MYNVASLITCYAGNKFIMNYLGEEFLLNAVSKEAAIVEGSLLIHRYVEMM